MQTIRDVMTSSPLTLPLTSSISDAARKMRDAGVGDVVVTDEWGVYGIVTERDIVGRALADAKFDAVLGEICSRNVVSVAPDEDTGTAVRLMRDKKVSRLVVLADRRLEGIVTLDDLEVDRTREPLRAIDSAPPRK